MEDKKVSIEIEVPEWMDSHIKNRMALYECTYSKAVEHMLGNFIKQNETITLSDEAFDTLVESLENPPEPSKALIDLMKGKL